MLAAVVALSAVAQVASQGAPTPCDEVDDDSIYNQTSCYSYDIDACKNNCPSNTMCDYFCGSGDDSCANGGGAVCSMRALSDIETTCNTVWSLTDDVLAAYTPSPDVDFDTTTMHMGCDKHVYCEFCSNSTACASIIDNMAEGVLGDTLYHKYYEYGGNLIYYGPMAMALLANITAVCDEMFPVEDRLTVSHTTMTSCGKGCSKVCMFSCARRATRSARFGAGVGAQQSHHLVNFNRYSHTHPHAILAHRPSKRTTPPPSPSTRLLPTATRRLRAARLPRRPPRLPCRPITTRLRPRVPRSSRGAARLRARRRSRCLTRPPAARATA